MKANKFSGTVVIQHQLRAASCPCSPGWATLSLPPENLTLRHRNLPLFCTKIWWRQKTPSRFPAEDQGSHPVSDYAFMRWGPGRAGRGGTRAKAHFTLLGMIFTLPAQLIPILQSYRVHLLTCCGKYLTDKIRALLTLEPAPQSNFVSNSVHS